jgi:hypothetical protein
MARTAVPRTIIPKWISLAREERQYKEQATAFARNAAQRHRLPRGRRAPHHGN